MAEARTPGRGAISGVAALDLTGMHSPDDLAEIASIEKVGLVLVPESLAGALARIPTRKVANVVPVPDGAEIKRVQLFWSDAHAARGTVLSA